MPDQLAELSEEETQAAFAALRAAALPQVHPPGSDAARRVLRRRRTVASTAAGVTLIGVAVGAAVTTGRAIPAQPPEPPSTGQRIATAPTSLEDNRLYAIGRDEITDPVETWLKPAESGTYRFTLFCAGTGGGAVTVTAGAQSASGSVTCSDPPVPSTVDLTISTRADVLKLRVDWDPGTVLKDTVEGWAVKLLGD